MAESFRPRKYDVTEEDLRAWVEAGESTVTIAARFKNCYPSTVWRWLLRLGIRNQPREKPSDEAPGKAPITKLAVFEAERAARNAMSANCANNAKPVPNELKPETA